ncbi:phosphoribosylamine--glycine ligase [Reinekea blandensis]|uniref:Phosphoribosylamine--glycine ligase n=1 Tax=Reinekea blandensis MED297 TaxID=314283 RepID=A4BFU2_9GAMM|nr:phosphoribosylamine--glycine ligase [Reinekea blandensis]EAR08960.1 Phosphoribosylamine-glycine ligase [Reinekea sp. MED297] [Reinekea blandensis MED297]
MNILIIGNGGREHALAWKTAQAETVERVFVAPGNAGTATESGVENVDIDALDFPALASFAKANQVALTIVGPEAPLVEGVVDHFEAEGLAIFGPTRAAAQLEGSKAFTKDFLARHQIPTAFYGVFTDENEAIAYIREKGAPIVVKADGLAAGKGVILAQTEQEAEEAVRDMLSGNRFGDAGARVVVEQFLTGEEASFIVMVDGEDVLPLATSQDHKARDNGDTGPNTGGMGAYSPAPVVTDTMHRRIMDEVILPTVKGMQAEGNRYRGFLYAGIMVGDDGVPYVLEYNCRFGDPETQPIMMRLQSNLAELCLSAVNGQLAQQSADWSPQAAIGVVMAAGGYPFDYRKGDVINGIDAAETHGAKVFQAGTARNTDGQLVTHGGRVLCVTALGEDVKAAQQAAYDAVSDIQWQDAYFRTDIGHRAINR